MRNPNIAVIKPINNGIREIGIIDSEINVPIIPIPTMINHNDMVFQIDLLFWIFIQLPNFYGHNHFSFSIRGFQDPPLCGPGPLGPPGPCQP